MQANDRTMTTTTTTTTTGRNPTDPAQQLDSSLQQHDSSTTEISHEAQSNLEVQQDNHDDQRKKRRRDKGTKDNRKGKKPKVQELDSSQQQSNLNTTDPSNPNSDRPSRTVSKKPLSGMTISVSTLQTSALSTARTTTRTTTSSSKTTTTSVPLSTSYQQACEICRELGATISELVSKRVDVVVCSPEAVQKATQRVRKAIKRNKPIVSLDWIYACRRSNADGRCCKVDMTPYRLEKEALTAMDNRNNHNNNNNNHNNKKSNTSNKPTKQSSSQEENPVERTLELGCCCVCHEQGTTSDCPWCQNCPK